MRHIYFVFIFLQYTFSGYGQLPANLIGSNPANLKWKQINTDKVKIIFPEYADSSAQRVANLIHYMWSKEDVSIGTQNMKVPIILNSEAAVSNGLVTVGPFRSEFFPTTRQFGNATDYIDLLTIHEYRHVRQFANATRGITRTVKSVLGSWAWGGMMALALPRWYFEGDAVITETDYTASGRGRLPSFHMQYHALFNEGIVYNYEKAGAGSLVDYVPDWYPLGYNILSFGRRHFGEDLWAGVAEDAARYKGLFYPFSRSLKRRTGMSTATMYDKAFSDLHDAYQAHIAQLQLNDFSYVGQDRSHYVTDYTIPKIYKGDTIMIRSAYDQLPSIIRIGTNGKEEKLCEIGRQLDGSFGTLSIGGDYIIWAQLAFDKRWRFRQYNDIFTYHIPTDTKIRLTAKMRYAAPALSQNGDKISTVFQNENLTQSIHILSTNDGSLLAEIRSNQYTQLAHPCWVSEDEVLVIATQNEKSRLAKVHAVTGVWEEITSPASDQLSNPYYSNGEIYFSSSYSGINNIYKVNLSTKDVFKLSEVPVGAFQPYVTDDRKWLLYTEMESNGMKAKKTGLDYIDPQIFEINATGADQKLHSKDYEEKSILGSLPDTTFATSKFNKWSGILNPHSLLAEINHPEATIRLLSDNVFGTLSGQAGATYNYNENDWSYFIGFNYAGLFPIINLSYVRSNRSAQFFNFGPLSDTTTVFTIFNQQWQEDRLTTGFTIPLNFSSGNTNARINLSANYQYTKLNVESNFESERNFRDTIPSSRIIVEAYDEIIGNTNISTLDLRLSSIAVMRQAQLHLQPRIGGAFSIRYRKKLGHQLSGGDVLNINGSLYLPGLASTHSFNVSYDFQKENVLDNYRYTDIFDYSRGYDLSARRDKFLKIGLNYAFPLWYPDLAVGPLAFVKRVKANMFYDYGRLTLSTDPFSNTSNMNSFGMEIGFDLRAFRLVEVDFGMRYSYRLNPEFTSNGRRHQFDFFLISITQ